MYQTLLGGAQSDFCGVVLSLLACVYGQQSILTSFRSKGVGLKPIISCRGCSLLCLPLNLWCVVLSPNFSRRDSYMSSGGITGNTIQISKNG
ncbi:hypothetical protein CJF30_00011416 [Rutstroemia sp. NJR-2017a BBW]|nr:hypothetical protein CJF30_00011416 [Rutstroemia sp. NJR-2017a BBW]